MGDRRGVAIGSRRASATSLQTLLPTSLRDAVALPSGRIRQVDPHAAGDRFALNRGAVVRGKGNPEIACDPQSHRAILLFKTRREACRRTL